MHGKLTLVIVIILSTVVVAWLDYSHSNPFINQPGNVRVVAQRAPGVAFKTVDQQQEYMLSDFRGKIILINFWASWCVPCLEEYPLLIKLAEENPENFILIMLSSDQTEKDAFSFSRNIDQAREKPEYKSSKLFSDLPNVYVAWDENKEVTREVFGTTRYPESIIIDDKGMMVQKIIGVLTQENIQQIRKNLSGGNNNVVDKSGVRK